MNNLLKLILFIVSLSLIACGSEADRNTKENPTEKELLENTQNDDNQNQNISGDLNWDDIPIYPGSVLEKTTNCPGKWKDCGECEHRIYVVEKNTEDVCTFFKDGMKENGWFKLVYQFYPEGSCMGAWKMLDTDVRVLMNIAKGGNDNKTFIAITLGKECP